MDLTKEPNPPFPVEIIDVKPVEVANPYSGQKVTLPPTAIAVYDCIKGAEMMGDYKLVERGIDWFIEHYPNHYKAMNPNMPEFDGKPNPFYLKKGK